jgi:hypothetical protein
MEILKKSFLLLGEYTKCGGYTNIRAKYKEGH